MFFFFTLADPSAKRLGVSKICKMNINYYLYDQITINNCRTLFLLKEELAQLVDYGRAMQLRDGSSHLINSERTGKYNVN